MKGGGSYGAPDECFSEEPCWVGGGWSRGKGEKKSGQEDHGVSRWKKPRHSYFPVSRGSALKKDRKKKARARQQKGPVLGLEARSEFEAVVQGDWVLGDIENTRKTSSRKRGNMMALHGQRTKHDQGKRKIHNTGSEEIFQRGGSLSGDSGDQKAKKE